MYRKGKLCLAVAVAGAGVLAAGQAAIAEPAQEGDSTTVYADVDGNGAADPVTVRKVDDATQVISFGLSHGTFETTAPAEYAVLQEPRVTDANRDGAQEVVVTIITGANTEHFQMFKYDPGTGITPVMNGPEPFTFHEGGGATARSGYQCDDTGKGPMFRTVDAAYDDASQAFDGESSWFIFTGNAVSRWTHVPFQDAPADDPRLNLDPQTCAP